MNNKPYILISNDDGIYAPGIKYLWRSLYEKFETIIMAPHREKSGASLSTTMQRPLHILNVKWENNTSAWKVTGTPTDTIKLALSSFLEKKPDLIVSGINKGSNAGRSVLYSGTVACAIEATFKNIPAIAFSCFDLKDPPYETVIKYIPHLVDHFLKNPPPKGTFINITFPPKNLEIKGFKMARQGISAWNETPDKRLHPKGHTYYWLGGILKNLENEKNNTDTYLLQQGYVTVVPIQINDLTHHDFLNAEKDNFEKLFENIKGEKNG